MPEGTTIKILGLDELKAKLDDLSKGAAVKCIRTALRAGAEIEQAAIEERCPTKDETGGILPEGALAADISYRITKNDSGGYQAIVGPGKLTRHVANWVEYGHRQVTGGRSKVLSNGKTRGPGTQVGEVPAHPFIRTAYEASRAQVTTAITTTLATEIEKAASKKGKA